MNIVYLLLGGNQGNVPETLALARKLLADKAGIILAVSSIYRSAAWGFQSNEPFLNQAIYLKTHLTAHKLLEVILGIERSLGRTRNETGYASRIIDIDILFINDEIVKTENLQIPHPRFHLRNFAILPLFELAPELTHPELNKSIRQIKDSATDQSLVEMVEIINPVLQKKSLIHNYIAIEGNIGAGKTTLARMLANQFNGKVILEQFENNPFLARFYDNQERYAFPVELSFLAERYQQLRTELPSQELFSDFTISDYFLNKSVIFARKTLNEDEYQLFFKLFNIMNANLPKPDLLVHLYVKIERLQSNIKKRGREYEQKIPDEYLENIQASYFEYLKQQKNLKVLLLDINQLDFVENLSHYHLLVDLINRDYPAGITTIIPEV
jgi:deoxyguanosine kinase